MTTALLVRRATQPFMVTCDDCGGEGGFYTPEPPHSRWDDPTPGERWDECPSCHGSGWIESDQPEPELEQDELPPPREPERHAMSVPQLVRRAITLSRRYADRGNPVAARRLWRVAERLSLRCGGCSGPVYCAAGSGEAVIVLRDGLVAHAPVPVCEGRAA